MNRGPVPAYKAYDAIEKEPNLIYAICIDYSLIAKIERGLLTLFSPEEARKAIRILQTLPKRTPGIGLRAWGTGASAEVNVHISVGRETKRWDEIHSRIEENGITDIIEAVNRRRTELVFDPEV